MTWPDLGIPYPVPRAVTPLSSLELARWFAEGFAAVRGGREPDPKLAATAAGIIGVENAGGRAFVQYNWGNISANLATYRGPFWLSPVAQPDQPIAFRAYSSHLEGATAWWALMFGHYLPVLQAAARGDGPGMVAELYRLGYVHGGSPRAYATAARAWSDRYRADGAFGSWGVSDVAALLLSSSAVAGLAAWRVYA